MAEYRVFIDESFNNFMNMPDLAGFISYGMLMTPVNRLADLSAFWTIQRTALTQAYVTATGNPSPSELKSTHIARAGQPARHAFANNLLDFCQRTDSYVAGFYTTVEGLLLFLLRSRIADQTGIIPDTWQADIEAIRQEFLTQKRMEPGESRLLKKIVLAVGSIPLHFMAALGNSFRIQYDPRNAREDASLLGFVDSILHDPNQVFQYPSVYGGVDNSLTSDQCDGLMVVDLITRDIRNLFQDVPALLTEGSHRAIISPQSIQDDAVYGTIRESIWAWGRPTPITAANLSQILHPTANSSLPLYRQRLANDMLSCYARWGEARIVNYRDQRYEDMLD